MEPTGRPTSGAHGRRPRARLIAPGRRLGEARAHVLGVDDAPCCFRVLRGQLAVCFRPATITASRLCRVAAAVSLSTTFAFTKFVVGVVLDALAAAVLPRVLDHAELGDLDAAAYTTSGSAALPEKVRVAIALFLAYWFCSSRSMACVGSVLILLRFPDVSASILSGRNPNQWSESETTTGAGSYPSDLTSSSASASTLRSITLVLDAACCPAPDRSRCTGHMAASSRR